MAERSFVTGGTGQIGRPLVRALAAAGHDVTVLVRDPARAQAVLADGARLLTGHLEDAAAIERGVAGADHVWHLAGGLRGVGRIDADRLNRVGTEALAVAAGTHAARLRSFTFASSCAVYGDRSGLWVGEAHPPAPQTEYGRAKLAAEERLRRVATATGLRLYVARIAAVYGPGLRFMQEDRIRAGRAWLPGEGRNRVPVVHIDDCVAALLAIAEKGAPGLWNVSAPGTPTLAEFYATVAQATGGKAVRFWSTWIPSVIQVALAEQNERLMAGIGRKPRFTNDNLRLFTASVRLRVDRLERELALSWRHPEHVGGIAASIGRGA
ncbi:MAG: NAD(P)-dependent oxidoreductase [Myxococcales bacterium]|nr:NAD(P)-dependent oxidoreductase [Myxococcales bacterium]